MDNFSEKTNEVSESKVEKKSTNGVTRCKIAIAIAIITTVGYFIYRAITSIMNYPVVANGIDVLFFVIIVFSCACAFQALREES